MAKNKALIFRDEGDIDLPPQATAALKTYSLAGLGQRLKMARSARKLSQSQLAASVGVSRAAISQWEAGTVEATLQNLAKAAGVLAVSLPWLISGDVARPSLGIDAAPAGMIAEMESGIGIGGPWHRAGLQSDLWRIPPSVLSELRCHSDELRIFRMMSPLMEPTIPRGAHVLVDFSETTAHDGQIYAIDNGVSLVIKRVFLHQGAMVAGVSIDMISDAATDHRVTLPLTQVRIAGRVVAQLVRPL